jgi:hypothetical protein
VGSDDKRKQEGMYDLSDEDVERVEYFDDFAGCFSMFATCWYQHQ